MASVIGACYVPKRYALVILSHFGFAVVYALRVNLSVALVAMVNSTYANGHSTGSLDPECPGSKDDGDTNQIGEFNWDQNLQGLILAAFFYGYLCTQIPGGIIAEKIGGKWVFGLGVFCTSLLTLFTPLVARQGVYLFIALRAVEGLGEAVTYPAMHNMLAHWAPPLERSILATIAYSGASVGTIISLPLSGILCESGFTGGWPSVFYVFGLVGILWFIVWAICVKSHPENQYGISKEELDYIKQTVGPLRPPSSLKYPWKSIFKSVAVWAILVTHFCSNWVFYTCLTSLPTYFKEVLNFSLEKNAFLSAVPYLVAVFMMIIGGYAADWLRSSRMLTTQATRKVFTLLGLCLPSVFLGTVGYIGCANVSWAVAFMTLSVGTQGFVSAGFNVNHLDIAPNYAGVLLAITNTVGTIPGCIAPSVVGYFTQNQPTRQQWQKVLFISSGISLFGGLFYAIFAQGTEQPWNREYQTLDNERDDGSKDLSPVNA